ncbi:MAG: hypothetical protein FH751_00735 [Firmicutes bacterium]|nr:hypothetical protein [Bacillota bacterium]
MKLIDKLKNRYNIFIIIIAVIFIGMAYRLSYLTIVKGDYYRDLAESKRLRKVPIPAPRGEIRDRYGRLLASNEPSFTVQVMKDELTRENKNKVALKLITLLEKEGENYVDEFPIKLNNIVYKNNENYKNGENPINEVVNLLEKHNLEDSLFQTYYTNKTELNNYEFITAERAKLILEGDGTDIPIDISLKNGKVSFNYYGENIDKWRSKENVSNLKPKDALLHLTNETLLRSLLKHPIIRLKAYEVLKNNGLADKFKIEYLYYSYDEDYRDLKRSLMDINSITIDSSAKDDFISIILNEETSSDEELIIYKLLSKVYTLDNQDLIIGKMFIKELKNNGVDPGIDISVNDGYVSFKYKDKENEESMKHLIDLSLKNKVKDKKTNESISIIKKVLTDDKVKVFSQKEILNSGINPKISVAKWKYTPIINKESWLSQFKSLGMTDTTTAKDAFLKLRQAKEINNKLSDYEARFIMLMTEQLNKQGYRGYQPVNIAYGVKDVTFAKIKENSYEFSGVKVEVQPARDYPMGKTAAHILGYLGKISQPFEIEKYLDNPNSGYTRNDIIGKTGIEQRYESELKGKDGYKKVEVDVVGNPLNVIDSEKAIPGNNLYLTIDAELQKVAEDSLKYALEEIQSAGEYKSKWGNYNYTEEKGENGPRKLKNATSAATVAIDVKTGELLAMANYPSYDPNLFTTGISLEDWESLKPENEDDRLAPRPLRNIAMRTAVQPGSIFKMVTGLAGLNKGMDPNKNINALGYLEYGGQTFGCWIYNDYGGIHGATNMYEAIKESCNFYFFTLAAGKNLRTERNIGAEVDLEDITYIAKKFGLDEKTGIEIPGERAGRVPSKDTKSVIAKRSFKNFLYDNKDKLKDGLTDGQIEKLVIEVSTWNFNMGRGEVINRLKKLGFDPYKNLKLYGNDYTLTDYIKYTFFRNVKFGLADEFNITIGQGENRYTPIQIANYIATLASDGVRHKVSVIDKLEDYNGNTIVKGKKEVIEELDLNKEYFNVVKKGMNMAAEDGTARRIFKDFPVKVGVKTGTAQATGYDNYAWFVAFAPYDDPQIAVSTIIFQGGHGGYAGPVAREVIAQYLGLNNKNEKIDFKNKLKR